MSKENVCLQEEKVFFFSQFPSDAFVSIPGVTQPSFFPKISYFREVIGVYTKFCENNEKGGGRGGIFSLPVDSKCFMMM